VEIFVSDPLVQMHNVQLTPEASKLLQDGLKDRFTEEFGDSFVLGIQTRSVFLAVGEFTTTTAEEQTNISGALDGGVFDEFSAGRNLSQRSPISQVTLHSAFNLSNLGNLIKHRNTR
jgi:hypothetical protein